MRKLAIISGIVGILGAGVVFGFQKDPVVIDPSIQGTEAVGIIIKDGKDIADILNEFTVAPLCVSEEASSTAVCTSTTFYETRPIKVYLVISKQHVNKDFLDNIGSFPFAGQVEYADLQTKNAEERLIQMIQEQGNKTYTLINE